MPLSPTQLLLLARSPCESIAVIVVGEQIGLIELCGLIVVSAANLPASDGTRSEGSRVLVLSNQIANGLNRVQWFLSGHGIRVEALHARIFRDASGDFVIITHWPETDPESYHHNGYSIESELDVFGDPVLAIVHNPVKETNVA